ncbi:MAG: hypothetical protein Kow00124_30030 [Anaerolineae bacterium]
MVAAGLDADADRPLEGGEGRRAASGRGGAAPPARGADDGPQARHGGWSANLWALALLAAVALAFYLGADWGNAWGGDEWPVTYGVSINEITYFFDRPLNLLVFWLTYPLVDAHPLPGYVMIVLLRTASAFLIYLSVGLLAPRRRLFAFACGAFYLAYMVPDLVLLEGFFRVSDMLGHVTITLAALYLYLRYLHGGHPALLIGGLGLAVVSIWGRESAIPLLFGAAPLAFAARWIGTNADRPLEGGEGRRAASGRGGAASLARGADDGPQARHGGWSARPSRREWIGLAVWSIVVLAASARYALPLLRPTGTGYSSYTGQLITTLDPREIIRLTLFQLNEAFSGVPMLTTAQVTGGEAAPGPAIQVLAALGVLIGALISMARVFGPEEGGEPETTTRSRLLFAGAWLIGGLALTWLGFAPYLPTWIARAIHRVHVLSAPGEGIALAAAAWLIAAPLRDAGRRRLAQIAALAFIAAAGIATITGQQSGTYQNHATWDSEAYFLRRLGHLIPAVEDNTLLLLMVYDPATNPPPFGGNLAYQYAIPYLYRDAMRGHASDGLNIAYDAIVTDAGIDLVVAPGYDPESRMITPTSHGWDEIIIIEQDEHGYPVILGELPEQYYTPARAALYDPYARIQRGFIPGRIQKLLPPILNPAAPPG